MISCGFMILWNIMRIMGIDVTWLLSFSAPFAALGSTWRLGWETRHGTRTGYTDFTTLPCLLKLLRSLKLHELFTLFTLKFMFLLFLSLCFQVCFQFPFWHSINIQAKVQPSKSWWLKQDEQSHEELGSTFRFRLHESKTSDAAGAQRCFFCTPHSVCSIWKFRTSVFVNLWN